MMEDKIQIEQETIEESVELSVDESVITDEAESEEVEVENSDEKELSETELLRLEVEELRAKLEKKESEDARMFAEIGEFSELFPEKKLESIPEEVWNRVREGIPLAAAYALYEKKTEMKNKLVGMVNEQNAHKSSGSISHSRDDLYYSPDEVRKMSASEVKEKYNIIIESMKKWN